MKQSKDYQNQEISEVIKEVRRIRHEISAEFGHDPINSVNIAVNSKKNCAN